MANKTCLCVSPKNTGKVVNVKVNINVNATFSFAKVCVDVVTVEKISHMLMLI